MQAIIVISLAMTLSLLFLNVFTKLECNDAPLGKILVYGQNLSFERNGNINKVENFTLIWLSCLLQDQKQLNLSCSGQNVSQIQVYAYGEYMISF